MKGASRSQSCESKFVYLILSRNDYDRTYCWFYYQVFRIVEDFLGDIYFHSSRVGDTIFVDDLEREDFQNAKLSAYPSPTSSRLELFDPNGVRK